MFYCFNTSISLKLSKNLQLPLFLTNYKPQVTKTLVFTLKHFRTTDIISSVDFTSKTSEILDYNTEILIFIAFVKPYSTDVCVPVSRLPEVIVKTKQMIKDAGVIGMF